MLSISIEKADRDFGLRMPLGYGVAWHNPECRTTTLILLPFNWPAAFLSEWYFRLIRGPRQRFEEGILKDLEESYQTGFYLGYKDGEKQVIRSYETRLKMLKEFVETHA